MKWGLTKRDGNKDYLSPFSKLREEMETVFDDFFSGHSDSLLSPSFKPAVDIKEDDKAIHVTAELPGLNEKDIEVQLENNVLTIKGEKKEENEHNDKNGYRMERRYGSFQRSFTLPNHVKSDDVKATFKNGVLNVELTKDESKAPKKLEIKVD